MALISLYWFRPNTSVSAILLRLFTEIKFVQTNSGYMKHTRPLLYVKGQA